MNNVERDLLLVKESLFSLPLVKEYLKIKEQVENNEELASFDKLLTKYKKEMTNNFANDEAYKISKSNYEEILSKYENHPLVVNYKALKEEVADLLNEVKSILE